GVDLRRYANKGLAQIGKSDAIKMLLHSLRQLHAAEEAAAAEIEVEQAKDAPPRQRARELLQLVELSGEVTAADQRTDRRAGNHADGNFTLFKSAQDPDMRPASGCAAAQ